MARLLFETGTLVCLLGLGILVMDLRSELRAQAATIARLMEEAFPFERRV